MKEIRAGASAVRHKTSAIDPRSYELYWNATLRLT